MPNVEARIRVGSKHFEILVDLDEALKLKDGKGDIMAALQMPNIYSDLKKGMVAGKEDLEKAFGTSDVYEVAKQIILRGEVLKPQEYRDAEKEKLFKQLVNLIVANSVDNTGKPFTEERIRTALREVHYNLENKPADKQLVNAVKKLKEVIPISLSTKKFKVRVPAAYVGQSYGLLKDFKESEDWQSNGDLEAVLNIPPGMVVEFFDKLNSLTHGSVLSEEIKEE